MALTLTEIQAITTDIWLPGVQDIWSKGNVFMHKMLEKVEKVGSGEKIRVPLEYDNARGGAFGETTVFETARKDILNAARFEWALYYTNITITIKDEIKVSGGEKEVNMVLTKLNNAQKTIRDIMGNSIWMSHANARALYGTETDPFYGLPDLFDQTATSYGDISSSDISDWKAYYDATGGVMSHDALQVLRRGCAINNDQMGKPDLYVTTEELKDAYELVLQAQQRFEAGPLAKAGFDSVQFGSRGEIVADDKCDSGYINAFNMDMFKMWAHEDKFFVGPVWKQPTNQPTKSAQILFAGCIAPTNRKAHGRRISIT